MTLLAIRATALLHTSMLKIFLFPRFTLDSKLFDLGVTIEQAISHWSADCDCQDWDGDGEHNIRFNSFSTRRKHNVKYLIVMYCLLAFVGCH